MSLTQQDIDNMRSFKKGNPEEDLKIDFTFHDRDDVTIPEAIHDVFEKHNLSYAWEWDCPENEDFFSASRLFSGQTKWAHEEYLIENEPFVRLSKRNNERHIQELEEFAKLRDEIKSAGLQIHASAHGALQQIKERPELQKFMQKQS